MITAAWIPEPATSPTTMPSCQPVVLRHHGMHGEGGAIGGELEQLGVDRAERAPARRPDMQHANDLSPDEQRHSEQGADTAVYQQRIPHTAVVDPVQDDRPTGGGDTAGEARPDRDTHALPDLLLDSARRGCDQLACRRIDQQDGGGVGPQNRFHPVEQGGEQGLLIEQRQCRISDRLDVPQPARNARILPWRGRWRRKRCRHPPEITPQLLKSSHSGRHATAARKRIPHRYLTTQLPNRDGGHVWPRPGWTGGHGTEERRVMMARIASEAL